MYDCSVTALSVIWHLSRLFFCHNIKSVSFILTNLLAAACVALNLCITRLQSNKSRKNRNGKSKSHVSKPTTHSIRSWVTFCWTTCLIPMNLHLLGPLKSNFGINSMTKHSHFSEIENSNESLCSEWRNFYSSRFQLFYSDIWF